MGNTPVIRRALINDAPMIASIHCGVWREALSFLPESVQNSRDYDYRLRQWQEHFERPHGGLFVAEVDDDLVGFGYARNNCDPDIDAAGELHGIHLLPQWRGGVNGVSLGRAMVGWCAEAGHEKIVTWAFKENVIRRFYSQIGFRLIYRRDRDMAGTLVPECGYVGSTFEIAAKLDAVVSARISRGAAAHAPKSKIYHVANRGDGPALTG